MRQRLVESPDSHDGLIDRSPSLSPPIPPAKAELRIVSAGCQTARELAHQAVLDREHDTWRIARECTARQLLADIQERALKRGTTQVLAQLIIVAAKSTDVEWPRLRGQLADWIRDAEILHDHLGKPSFDDAMRQIYFDRNPTEAAELARIRRNLTDALY